METATSLDLQNRINNALSYREESFLNMIPQLHSLLKTRREVADRIVHGNESTVELMTEYLDYMDKQLCLLLGINQNTRK